MSLILVFCLGIVMRIRLSMILYFFAMVRVAIIVAAAVMRLMKLLGTLPGMLLAPGNANKQGHGGHTEK